MAILDVNERLRRAALGVPKAWVAFGLAAALWALLYAMGAEGFQVLRQVRF